jgi:hypothetical protein
MVAGSLQWLQFICLIKRHYSNCQCFFFAAAYLTRLSHNLPFSPFFQEQPRPFLGTKISSALRQAWTKEIL